MPIEPKPQDRRRNQGSKPPLNPVEIYGERAVAEVHKQVFKLQRDFIGRVRISDVATKLSKEVKHHVSPRFMGQMLRLLGYNTRVIGGVAYVFVPTKPSQPAK